MFARSRAGARGVTLALVGLLTATTLAPSLTFAQESLAPGSVATNAGGETVLVRTTPGWDGAAAGEVAPGSQVTVSDYPVTAADGSQWYPVAGGYVPASALAGGDAAAAPEVTGQVSGYYDTNGMWVEETAAAPAAAPATGYVDENGVWVDTTAQAAPADQSTGYVDANGVWVDTTVQAAPVEPSTGYVDANGIWVDTTGQAAEAAPVAEPTGYVDANGVWVDTTAQAAPVEQTAPVDQVAVAPVQSSGYLDQNGVWVDTTGMNQASGTVVYENASGQSNINSNPSQAAIGTAYIAGTNGEGAICRAGADWASAEIGSIPEGSAVEVTGGTVGEWQPVNCNGVSGYVHASFVSWNQPVATDTTMTATGDTTVVEQPSTYRANRNNRNNRRGNDANAGGSGQALVDFASGYLGHPYVYAGAGPNGFDCSGFTMFVVQRTLGIDISHSVPTQYSMGTPVGRNELQPGDLVFFENTFQPGLSHVGIYIGGGQFIHAENESTGVVISDLNSDYYSRHYYGAARFT